MKHGTCIHFNGTINDACKRGVNYEVNWPKSPKPCIQFIEKSVRGGTVLKPGEEPAERKPFPGADTAKPCPFWEAPTDEQVQAGREALDRSMRDTMAAMKLANAWRVKPKPDANRHEVVVCPACQGRLHLNQSSYNGHVHGKCETQGCVSWM